MKDFQSGYRPCRSRSSARMMTSSAPNVERRNIPEDSFGGSVRDFAARISWKSPRNGTRPVSHSYIRQPRL